MDKLELDLDDLEVNSFQTNPVQKDEKGTVQGNNHSCHSCEVTCDDQICDPTRIGQTCLPILCEKTIEPFC